MNKLFLPLSIIVIISLVFASSARAVVQQADFNISLIGQDPSPAIPGKYVDLTFSASGGATYAPSDVTFEVIEGFPFSLEPGESKIKNLGNVQVIGRATEKNELLYKIRLLVDGKAADGDNDLEYKYSLGGYSFTQKIQISVSNVRTDFDVIVQEVSSDSVSFGIVNTGENPAKSVVVKVLGNKNFETTNVDSSILGNLASGDFTVTTFKLISKTSEKSNLRISISYTDTEGTRHTVEKYISLQLTPTEAAGAQKEAKRSPFNNLIIIVLILLIIALVYMAFFKKKK